MIVKSRSNELERLKAAFSGLVTSRRIGRVSAVGGGVVEVSGLSDIAMQGDQVRVIPQNGPRIGGEVLSLSPRAITVLLGGSAVGISIGDLVELIGPVGLAPDPGWIGRVIDPFGQPLDGAPLGGGTRNRPLQCLPPPATERRPLGQRLETGLSVFNTLLPIVRGQRIGLFAGSGVGKSSLLSNLAKDLQADVVVIALVGERGREVRDFVEDVLGPDGMARSVVVAATSDQSPLMRRRCALAAMCVAESFRDQGLQVLLLVDSITRFAEAHREIAIAAGEPSTLRGFPASTSQSIMSLCERAGPGLAGQGDITAVFSVLVAGSDMDEPVADILRGVLDGHIVMDRKIAERGRFPAIDLLRSVSRSLPRAATSEENALIANARRLLGAYDRSEMMIQAGLYTVGSDPLLDAALRVWPQLDAFLAETAETGIAGCFHRLAAILEQADTLPPK
ncbi:FliI/YscN family ATPase [Pseudogemmobacter sp. W21_MBD1_M6]